MDKFCTYCGRPLKEGERCYCKQNESKKARNGNVFIKNLWKLITNTFKRPASTIKIFITNLDYKFGLIIIALNSLFLSLVTMMGVVRINYSLTVFGLYFTSKSFSYMLINLVSLLVTAALFALFVMLFVSSLGAKRVNIKQAICVVGAKSLGLLPFAVLAFLISIFYPSWGTGLVNIGEVLSYLFVYFAFRELMDNNENTSVYAFFLAIVCQMATKSILISLTNALFYGNRLFF